MTEISLYNTDATVSDEQRKRFLAYVIEGKAVTLHQHRIQEPCNKECDLTYAKTGH
jgi:hypothetical protein